MKRNLIIGTLAVAIVAVLGLTAFSFASAKSGFDREAWQQAGGPGFEDHDGERGALRPYLEEETAGILGMTVDELQDALAGGTRLGQLVEDAGLTLQEFKETMDAALPDIVAQALEDGAITEAQADFILENGLRRPGQRSRRGFGPLNPYVVEASAGILGIDADDLQAALADGTPIEEILDEAGFTLLEYRMAIDEATPDIVAQALEDGAITEDQAQRILDYGLWPAGCRDGHHRPGGPGPDGPRPEGFSEG